MQTACWEMPWLRALRAVALVLAVVLGLEWTVPLGGYAQSNQEPASAPAASVGNQDLPPIQEAEASEEDRPILQKMVVLGDRGGGRGGCFGGGDGLLNDTSNP